MSGTIMRRVLSFTALVAALLVFNVSGMAHDGGCYTCQGQCPPNPQPICNFYCYDWAFVNCSGTACEGFEHVPVQINCSNDIH